MIVPDHRFLRDNAPWLSAGLLLCFGSSYGQTYFISVFAGDIRAAFGLSHGGWGAIYSAGTLMAAVLMVWAGGWADRLRVRTLGSVVMLGCALACLSMALVPSAIMLVLVIMALRFFGQGMSSLIASTAMVRWFAANRGKALSVSTLGFAIGEASLPLIFVALKSTIDWRMLWVLAGGLSLLGIPILLSLLRRERTPMSLADTAQVAGLFGRHWTRGEVMRLPVFWAVQPGLMAVPVFSTSFYFHQVHLAAEKGWSHAQLVALFPIGTATAITTMLLSGIAIDRFGAARLLAFLPVPLGIGFLIMSHAVTPLHGAVAIVFFAITAGCFTPVPAAFWAEYFGTRHMGSIRALAMSMMVLGTAIGPVLTGAFIDAGVSFPRQMPWITLYCGLSALLILLELARMRRRVERQTGEA